jgi:hypothetical protein
MPGGKEMPLMKHVGGTTRGQKGKPIPAFRAPQVVLATDTNVSSMIFSPLEGVEEQKLTANQNIRHPLEMEVSQPYIDDPGGHSYPFIDQIQASQRIFARHGTPDSRIDATARCQDGPTPRIEPASLGHISGYKQSAQKE